MLCIYIIKVKNRANSFPVCYTKKCKWYEKYFIVTKLNMAGNPNVTKEISIYQKGKVFFID